MALSEVMSLYPYVGCMLSESMIALGCYGTAG